MGILRTDKISGLETPTAVTGSVSFDGNDHLSIGSAGDFNFLHNALSDWTAEFWVKTGSATRQFAFGTGASSAQVGFSIVVMSTDDNQSDGTGVYAQFGRGSAGNYRYWGSNGGLTVDTWHHVAAVFKASDKTLVLYVDGIEVDSGTGTANGTFSTTDYSTSNSSYAFLVAKNEHSDTYLTGEISNLRVVNGRRLYTSDFTPPVHALETIDGTRILCCNNPDSVTAVSNAGVESTPIATASGDPTVATDNPSLTRDFTSGTEFKGVTTFDTQGYFVPPSGTTTERYPTGTGGAGAGTRGVVFGGYYPSSPNRSNVIDYITIASLGNAQDFGDRLNTTDTCAACASATRALNAGGYNGSATINTIEYVTIASTGNAVDFGDTRIARRNRDGCASSTRGLFGGGYPIDDAIDYVTIATQGTSSYFGNLTSSRYNVGGLSSPTRGVFAGGQPANGDTIEYVTIATTGDAVDFGNLTASSTNTKGASSTTRGIFGHNTNVINYITIASLGDAQDFGDLNYNPNANTCTSSLIRGVFMGGGSPTTVNTISYITIASTGDAVDFGDLTQARQSLSATSSGHGGLG